MNRKDYLKNYELEHYEYRRLYRTEWQRLKRKGLLGKITVFEYIEKKLKFTIYKKREGHCASCDILLISKYAEGHDGVVCGDCLKRDEKKQIKKDK